MALTSEYGWPNVDADGNEIDFPKCVSFHLADGEVAIFMQIGWEGMREIGGFAQAINSKGEMVEITLDDIFELAKPLRNASGAEF